MAIGDKKFVVMQSDIGLPGGVAPAGHITKSFVIAKAGDIAEVVMQAYAATGDYKIGFYIVAVTAELPAPNLTQGVWHMTVYRTDEGYGRIDLVSYGLHVFRTARYMIFKDQETGSNQLSELMWDDPPMTPGLVYCTTECYEGKPVYCVALTGISIDGNVSAMLPEQIGRDQLVSVSGHVGDYPIPTYIEASSQRVDFMDWVHSHVQFKCTSQFASMPYRIIVKYTKE